MQIAALSEPGGFENATAPASFRKAGVTSNGTREVPLGMACGLHAPEAAIGTNVSVPSLLPMKKPPQRLRSIWPCAFSAGMRSGAGLPTVTPEPTGTPGKKPPTPSVDATHQVHVDGGVSPEPTMRTAAPPEGRM